MNKDIQCAMLIVSCDKYQDLWNSCIVLLRKFWKDCPFKVYLLSNNIKANFTDVISICVGNDHSWSESLQNALHQIPEKYVLLYIEDLYLIGHVQSDKIVQLLEWAIEHDINYLRLNPTPAPDIPYNDDLGIISKGSVYRSSVVFSVWKKELLSKLLIQGENAWEFEEIGTVRSDDYDGFYASTKELIPACNTVIKGVWEKEALKKITKLGLKPDLAKRRAMNATENLVWKLKTVRTAIFLSIPPRFQRRVKALFR